MRRLLVLAYYFPPLGGSGVQRITKLVKYLPRFGWEPEVVTAAPRRYLALDESLREEVERAGVAVHATPSIDPTRIGRAGAGGDPSNRRRALARWLTGTLFLPDNKLGWYPFALRQARARHRAHPFDAVLSTAPPYTSHLVAARLAEETGLPLLLDYRDDWLGNPRHHYPSRWHFNRHERLEQGVLTHASAVMTINETIARAIRERAPGRLPVHVVPQGFDPADFNNPLPRPSRDRMRIVYTGMFYDVQRPDAFLEALARLRQRRPDAQGKIEAVFAGHVPASFAPLVSSLGLNGVVRYEGYVSHQASIDLARSADLLWMTVGEATGADQISTSKLFEYFGTRKPVLGLVPPGEAALALEAYGCGVVAPPDDVEAISRRLEECWNRWKAGDSCAPVEQYLQAHDRINIAQTVAQLFDTLVAHRVD